MRLTVKDVDKCIGCQSCMFACARRKGEAGLARSSIGIRSAGGMERGFIVIVCRACSDPPCAKVCPTGALVAKEDFLNIGEEIHREKYSFKIQEGFSLDNYRLPERIFETASSVGKIDKTFVHKVVKCVNNEIFK